MAASRSRPVFNEEDDDSDSVNTDSTIQSDLDEEYSVEKILTERKDDHGTMLYLVKWEGYELHRSTWEPKEHFVDIECLVNWKIQKRDIDEGRLEPFDLARFNAAVRLNDEQRERRRAKRAEKRRQKEARGPTPRRRLLSRKDLAKKGTARKAPARDASSTPEKSRQKQATPLFEPSSPVESAGQKRKRSVSNQRSPSPARSVNDALSSQLSLFNDRTTTSEDNARKSSSPRSTAVPKRARVTNPPTKQKLGTAATVVTSRPKPAPKEVVASSSKSSTTKLAKPSTVADAPTLPDGLGSRRASEVTSVAKDRPGPAASTVAKNVAKTAGPSRRTAPISMFIEPKAKPRQRPRVDEYTPKDSTDPQFVNLAMKRRMQLYSRNEPPPDPDALTFVNSKTGKALDENQTPSTSNTLRLDTDVARISDVPNSAPASERRSISTAESQREALPGRVPAVTPWSAQGTEPRFAYPLARTNVPHLPRKPITCRFWSRGTCRWSEESCPNAHAWTGQMAPKIASVCKFWEKGRCQYSEEECEYYHTHDFPRNVDGARREALEDVNGFRMVRRRSESPDHSGLRQDEVEERRGRGRVDVPHFRSRADERTPIQSPSLASTASFEPRRDLPTANATMTGLTDPPIDVAPASNLTVAILDSSNEKDVDDPVDFCLSIKPASQPSCTMDVKLSFDTMASRAKFLDVVGEKPSLESSEICRSRDFEAYWFAEDVAWASGGLITPGDTVTTYLEDYLVLHSSCISVRTSDFIFVVYPTQNPDWKFMPHRGPEKPGLRWYLQAPMPGTSDPIVVRPSKSSFISMCAEYLNLNPEILFAGNRCKQVEKVVYLLFPKGTPETKLIEVFFSEVGARFFHSEDCDLWNQFCGKGSTANRVILIHPSMNAFWKIPDFWNVLMTGMNIFQVGVSKTIKERPDSPIEYNCIRLFPSGTLTLITDDIFKYHPAEAAQVLSIYIGYKVKPEGGRTDRIYCRPGILAWLAELIDEDGEKGLLTEDSPRIKCWQLACELLGTPVFDYNRNPFRMDVKPSMLYSPPKSEMSIYGPMWDSSEQEATDWLVNWFAGHAVEECEYYRRFNVLYEQQGAFSAQTPGLLQPENPKDPKEWMKKYTHVKVTTPARFVVQVENYEKSKKVPL